MKKRLLSLILIIAMLLAILPAGNAFAEETVVLPYSEWALDDLVVGDTYNIYPMSWYEKDMDAPITHAQIRQLMAGIRLKLYYSGKVIEYNEQKYNLKSNMTVEEILEFLYTMISDYEFDGDIGITDGGNALEYMAKHNIFTGNEGELSLEDICTIEQAFVIATRLITHIYNALDAASKGFLWKIESDVNTVYLLGSVHAANYYIYPFSDKILDAFAESDVLCVEANVLDISGDVEYLFMQYGMYNDGTQFKDHVSEETYQKTVQLGAMFGLSEETIALFKPWMIYNTFATLAATLAESEEELALSQKLGIDVKFLVDAYYTGKPIFELEGIEFQIKLYDSLSDELIEYLLNSTIDSIINGTQEADAVESDLWNLILYYWHEGDVEGFMENVAPLLTVSEFSDDAENADILPLIEEFIAKFITERDRGMADKIDGLLKAEGGLTYFIVVGSGHYISDYSVIDILKEKGYEVNQIK